MSASAQFGAYVGTDDAPNRECLALQSPLGRLLKLRDNGWEKEQHMKVYQVVRRGGKWHVHMPGASSEAPSSEDRGKVVAWLCELAKKQDATVQVRDIGGQVEMTYTYAGGVEHRYGRDKSHAGAGRYVGETPRHRTLLRRLLYS
jgi:hypothetical protein